MLEFASPQKILGVLKSLHLRYIRDLFAFAFRNYPVLYACTVMMMISVMFEALAMSTFVPLSAIASGKAVSGNHLVMVGMRLLEIPTSPKYLFLTFIVLFTLRIVSQIYAERVLMNVLENRMLADLVSGSLANIVQYSSISDIENKSAGQYIMLANEEVHRASLLISTTIRLVGTGLLASLYYGTILLYSPPTGLGIVVFLALSGLGSYGVFKYVHRQGALNVDSSRAMTSIFVDALNGVRSVRSFGAEKYVLEKFKEQIYPHKRRVFLIGFFTFLGKTLPMLVLVVLFGMFILISSRVSNSAFDYAFAVTLLIFLLRFFLTVGEGLNVLLKVISDARAAADITEVIQVAPEVLAQAAREQEFNESIISLAMRNVSFSHNKKDPVLLDFSVEFQQGNVYAILGESGAGKSTLLDVLLKFHRPDAGAVLVNNRDITAFSAKSLRRRMVFLGQETIIFNDTVRNNICYGLEANDAELKKACAIAMIDDVIKQLPNGFDTPLQYRGTNLSGGQRQRIGIARAVLRNPDVLIFDESMSALDQATKESVIRNILAAFHDRIVIFVSHDPTIRAKVDVVIEMTKIEMTKNVAETL